MGLPAIYFVLRNLPYYREIQNTRREYGDTDQAWEFLVLYPTKGGAEQQIPLKSAVNVAANEISTESRQLEMQQNQGSLVALQLAKELCPSDYHGVFQRRKGCIQEKKGDAMARKQGSFGGEMRMRVREHFHVIMNQLIIYASMEK